MSANPLDATFGAGGTVLTDFNNGSNEEAHAIVVQPDSRFIVVGGTGVNEPVEPDHGAGLDLGVQVAHPAPVPQKCSALFFLGLRQRALRFRPAPRPKVDLGRQRRAHIVASVKGLVGFLGGVAHGGFRRGADILRWLLVFRRLARRRSFIACLACDQTHIDSGDREQC
ncbi:MAG TPA: hypothetical protein VHB99_11960 [Pirellulales bacterium]|nr:hypothetical protein [Pirellulales bacterium]